MSEDAEVRGGWVSELVGFEPSTYIRVGLSALGVRAGGKKMTCHSPLAHSWLTTTPLARKDSVS